MKQRKMVFATIVSLVLLFGAQAVFAAPTIKIGVAGAHSADHRRAGLQRVRRRHQY